MLLGLFTQLDRSRYLPLSLLPKAGPLEEELRRLKVPYFILDTISGATRGTGLSKAILLAQLTAKYIRRPYSILHSQCPVTYRLPSVIARFTAIRRICHLHFPPSDASTEVQWAFKIHPHMVIACSRSVADLYRPALASLCPSSRLRVIENFADTKRFMPGPCSTELRAQLSLGPSDHVITIVGQIGERKGHPDFLRMAQSILRVAPKARFLIAGEDLLHKGSYQRQMESYAAALGISAYVSFLGFRPDIPEILRLSDVIVLPSYAEGMPLSLIEASACAKAVVAYSIPGTDEVVLDGKTGALTKPGDTEALASAVLRIVLNPQLKDQMGAAGRALVENRFSLDAYVSNVQAAYADTDIAPRVSTDTSM